MVEMVPSEAMNIVISRRANKTPNARPGPFSIPKLLRLRGQLVDTRVRIWRLVFGRSLLPDRVVLNEPRDIFAQSFLIYPDHRFLIYPERNVSPKSIEFYQAALFVSACACASCNRAKS